MASPSTTRRSFDSPFWFALLAALLYIGVLCLTGCVATGIHKSNSETTYQDGKPLKTTTSRFDATHTDARAFGAEVGNAIQTGDFLGVPIGKIAAVLGGGAVGSGGLGLLIGKLFGHNKGWDDRERAGAIQQPLPQPPTGGGAQA